MDANATSFPYPDVDKQAALLKTLQVFKIGGKDKAGRKILRIVGKYFPARAVSGEGLRKYLEEDIFPALAGEPFSVVYVHTGVVRADNFPGMSILRSSYEAAPLALKNALQAVYFLHPGLQARLFFATFGRLIFGSGLCAKLRYIKRVEFMVEWIRRRDVDVPDFVYDHEEELDHGQLMDYGLDNDADHNHHHHHQHRCVDLPPAASIWALGCTS